MDWDRVGEIALLVFTQGWSFLAVSLAVFLFLYWFPQCYFPWGCFP